ncbi:MAG TPA: G8 domain-containing protein [bacterium]|nr:G8 domain-containing protein [bacterium]
MNPLDRKSLVVLLAASLLALALPPSGQIVHAGVTVTALRTGNWSDATLWTGGRAPAAGDTVVIPAGFTVTYDRFSDVEMAKVTIRGKLKFSRTTGTRLDTGNVIVESGGHLDMGTAAEPIPANIDAELRLVTSPTGGCVGGANFAESDIGLWVMPGGRWDANGWPLRHTWVKLIEDAPAGDTVLKVRENVSDWEVGSTLLVTPTSRGLNPAEFEQRTIVRATYLGTYSEIQLSQGLSAAHSGAPTTGAEVALLSRNVVVSSKYPTYPMNGHTVFMHTAAGSVGYAEFRDLGMFGCLGRYPLHFHMMEDASRGMVVRGASIWRSDNHFLNVHASNGILFEDVVGYDTTGVGYFVGEAAAGMLGGVDNVFIHNLSAKVIWRAGALDGRNRAAGFWIASRNNVFIDNAASGTSGISTADSDAGFHFAEGGTFVATFRPLVMVRNESHSNRSNGFLSWINPEPNFIVLDFRGWRNGSAGFRWGAYFGRWQMHRAKLYENGEFNALTYVVGWHLQDSELYGSAAFPTPIGLLVPAYGTANDPNRPSKLLRNVFSNHGKDFSQDHLPCSSSAEGLNPLSEVCSAVYVVSVGTKFNSPVAIDFGWQRNANSYFTVRGWSGAGGLTVSTGDFRLTRRDRPRPDVDAFYYQLFDAWLDPLPSLSGTTGPSGALVAGPAGGASGQLVSQKGPSPSPTPIPSKGPRPAPTPTPNPSGFYSLPTIAWVSPQEGDVLGGSITLDATVGATIPISNVKFYADEQLLATVTAPPFRYTWSSSTWARRRAYVYACVTDTAANLACTPVLKLIKPGF